MDKTRGCTTPDKGTPPRRRSRRPVILSDKGGTREISASASNQLLMQTAGLGVGTSFPTEGLFRDPPLTPPVREMLVPTNSYGDLGLGSELNQQDYEIESWYSVVTSSLTVARDFITNGIIRGLSFLGKLVEQITPLVVHLSSSIVNFIVNLYGLFQKTSSLFYKSILSVSLLSSFSSFITSIGDILSRSHYSWVSQSALYAARQFVSDLTPDRLFVSSNSLDPGKPSINLQGWVKIGICGIFAALMGGLGLTKLVDWKQLTQSFNLLGSAHKAYNSVSSCADFVLENILGVELEVDYAAAKELEDLVAEGAHLQNCSPAHFIQNPLDHCKLVKFSEKIVKVTSRPVSRESSQRYQSTRSLLVQMYKVLSEKLTTVNAILATKQRQATVGVFFSGPPAVGKSTFCEFVARKVGDVLGYNPSLYTLNKKSDGFF